MYWIHGSIVQNEVKYIWYRYFVYDELAKDIVTKFKVVRTKEEFEEFYKSVKL